MTKLIPIKALSSSRETTNYLLFCDAYLLVSNYQFFKDIRGVIQGTNFDQYRIILFTVILGLYVTCRLCPKNFFFGIFLFFRFAFALNIGFVSGIRFMYDSVRLIIITLIQRIIFFILVFMFVFIVFNNKVSIQVFHYISQIIFVITFISF